MTNKTEVWIIKGYEIFSILGVEGLKIEKLAKEVGISKSSFYHYFADLDVFIDKLLIHYSAFPNSIINEHTRFCNYDGPDTYTMDIKKRAHHIRILIRKNPDLKYEDDWFYHLSDYEFSFKHELKPKEELESCILLAVELNQSVLLRKVYNAVQKLIFELGLEKYKERFENDFPQDLVSKLKQLIDSNNY